jgi:hypothetical protein
LSNLKNKKNSNVFVIQWKQNFYLVFVLFHSLFLQIFYIKFIIFQRISQWKTFIIGQVGVNLMHRLYYTHVVLTSYFLLCSTGENEENYDRDIDNIEI